jgi:endonuclease/exonuclease/phosphatase family metal-dependent hydrolase
MNGRRRRLVGLLTCLVCAAVSLTGSPAPDVPIHQPFRVIQLNLCNSGIAGCYTGRAVNEATAVIRAETPELVTLNEVCEEDVTVLGKALMEVHHGGVVWAFKAADDRRTSSAVRCVNGQAFGIGLLAHLPAPQRGYTTDSGIYPTQDLGDPEERAWLCLHVPGAFYACTTHLANTSTIVALAQCRYLLYTLMPSIEAANGNDPTVLGGDLNLHDGGSPDVRACLPSGYLRAGDGDAQHIVATADFTVGFHKLIDMHQTTDHPGLLVELQPGA